MSESRIAYDAALAADRRVENARQRLEHAKREAQVAWSFAEAEHHLKVDPSVIDAHRVVLRASDGRRAVFVRAETEDLS